MPDDQARAITRWHEDAYAAMKAEAGTGQRFTYLGLDLWVPAEVMPVTAMSRLLGDAVVAEVRGGDRVLDMGTGCGVNALLAARVSASVVAVDVNPVAVEAARANAEANGLADRVEVRHGDLFDTVPEAFDLVVFDPPFRWFPARDLLESAITDPDYRTLTTFFGQVRDHLRPGGRLLMFFGSSGDLAHFRTLAARAGFVPEVIGRRDLERDGHRVEYLTFRLTLPAVGAAAPDPGV
jgi:release factor glutamine methyltransferase